MLNVTLRKTAAAVGLAAAMIGASAEAISAAQQNFRVYNETGRTMVGLWVSEADSDYWGNNILSRALPDDYNTAVVFPNGSSDCLFDIAAKFSDGSTAEDYGVNLCQVAYYTFYP